MNRRGVFIIIYSSAAIVVIAAFWIIGRWTGILQFYHSSTSANEPAIGTKPIMFGSNLKKPERGDFIFYRLDDSSEKVIYVHRLCGLSGDTLEVRKGILYVNGKNFDQNLNLKHKYAILTGTALVLKAKGVITKDDFIYNAGDSTVITIVDKFVVTKGILAKRKIMSVSESDEYIKKKYETNWNADHFGPIIVPPNHYFVLGDNRDNSLDSRYTGFISINDWVGTKF